MKTPFLPVLTLSALALTATLAFAAGPLDDALVAFKAGEYEKAVAAAAQVGAEDPLRGKALYVTGEAELARGRFAEAKAAFEAVLAAKKDAVPALTGLGRAQAGAGEREAAEKTLRRAVELDAKDPAARRALGELLVALERTDEARKELEAASKLDPKDPLTARALVEAHLRAAEPDAAKRVADAFAKAVPDSATAHFLKALVLDRRGKGEDAIAVYEKAIEADPRYLDAHKNLAILYTTTNHMYQSFEKVEKACAHAQKYVDLGGRDTELKDLLDQIKGYMEQMRNGRGGR